MIYQRKVIKELSISSVSIFIILFIILLSIQLVKLLGQVAKGLISIDWFVTAVGVSVVSLLPLLLCATCYISTLTILSRYWRDSEMLVWLSSAVSLKKWIYPISLFALPFVLILLGVTLYFIPVINAKSFAYSQYLKERPSIDFIEQGVFVPVSNGVIFIEEFDSSNNRVKFFFSHEVDPESGKFEITLAKDGSISLNHGNVQVTLNEANRYLGYPTQADFSIFTIPKVEYDVKSNRGQKRNNDLTVHKESLPTSVLWKSDNSMLKSALMWRISIPLATIILVLLAIPLSYTDPRSGRNYNIIIAILVFFLYQNSLILVRNLISREVIGFWIGLVTIHGIMLLVTWILFQYRMSPRTNFYNFLKLSLGRNDKQ